MAIINVSRPISSLTNSTKINIEETWGSNTTTWGTETRTWGDMASLIDNDTKISSSITNISKPV